MIDIRPWILKNMWPSRGNHITESWNLYENWEYCKQYYGPDFNIQLVNFKRNTEPRVLLPSMTEFRDNFLKYLNHGDYYDTFKTQWLLNDLIIDGKWKFPVQAVYNFKMKWWEIHPGRLRGLLYNLLEINEWLAWYMPMDDTQIEYVHKFYDVDTLLNTMNFKEYYRLDGELIDYFGKPMIKLCILKTNKRESTKEHMELFFKNTENGLNIEGDIELIKREVDKWPNHTVKDRIVYNQSNLPTLTIDRFVPSQFYAGLHFFGTKIKEFNKDRIHYSNLNQLD